MSQGPLSGMKVVEFAGIGPGPMCGMLLADLAPRCCVWTGLRPAAWASSERRSSTC
jgi:crotonobetainyl-CoA:carnitine CoA-transferase CaiB-like acyl-CoA transferase